MLVRSVSVALLIVAVLPILPSCRGGAEPAPPPADKIQRFKIDPGHSAIAFEIRHLQTTFVQGRFNEFSGDLVLNFGNARDCSVSVEIDAASIDTNHEKRDEHLRSEEFFDVANHPTITFRSTGFLPTRNRDFRIEGEMTLNGQTRTITANAAFTGSIERHDMFGTRVGYRATFTIRRSDFGMTAMLGPVGDEIPVTMNIEAILQE